MTVNEFKAALRGLGLTPSQPVYSGGMIYRDRDGEPRNIPDPSQLSTDEREDLIATLSDLLNLR